MTKQLQGGYLVNAVFAKDLKIGDIAVWNFGSTSTITNILKTTNSFITFETDVDGKKYSRKLKKTKMIGMQK